MVDSEVRGHYTTRVFSLTDTVTGENRTVKQFHYADWPDFNVPDSPDNFLAFLQDVRQSGWFSQDSGPPVGQFSDQHSTASHICRQTSTYATFQSTVLRGSGGPARSAWWTAA